MHKDLVADFHEASAVGSWVGLAILSFVLMLFAKIVEYLGIWAAWITDWRGFDAATTGPPVFFVVIEKDAFVALNTALVAILGSIDFGDFSIDAGFFEDLLPNASSLIIAWDAIFFITNKTSDVNFLWIETDLFG